MRRVFAVVASVLLSGCAAFAQDGAGEEPEDGAPAAVSPTATPRNVVLFIGDGMGPNQVTLGRLVKGEPLFLDSIPDTGLAITTSYDNLVTDSAAAATALSSGVKTRNKSIGVGPDGKPVRLITEDLLDAGFCVGIATNTRITHATPAGFYGHVSSRSNEAELARQLLDSRVTIAMGGGWKHFRARLTQKEEGYIALFAPDHMLGDLDRETMDSDEPPLEQIARRILGRLTSEERGGKPFFAVIEGGRIDHACHGHDAPAAAREVIAFDAAVRAGVELARERGDTLVIVTADHATGGMSVSEATDLAAIRRVKASAWRMLELAKGDAAKLRAIVKDMAGIEITEGEAADAVADRFKYARGGSLAHLISRRLGVHFAYPLDVQDGFHATEGHDATMVPVYAVGPGADRFRGTMDNTDIPKRIRALLGVASPSASASAPEPEPVPVPGRTSVPQAQER